MSDEPKNIKDMTEEEIKKELLFNSYFITQCGPQCHCTLSKLTHFHGYIPEEMCGKDITDMEYEKDLETTATTVCPCQEGHTYTLKVGPEGVSFEEIDSDIMDRGKLRLPNFREY